MAASSLDPIFPIPAGTGLDRNLKPGQGAEILANDTINPETGLTYRAFWHIWEQTELNAAKLYPRYVTQNPNVAATWLEAVLWCRNIAYRAANFGEGQILAISEEEAAKIRAKETGKTKKSAAKKAGEPAVRPVEAPEPKVSSKDAKKGKKKAEKGSKKKSKKNKKKGKE